VAPPLLVVTEGGPVWRQASNVLLQVWKPSCLVKGDPVLRRWVSGSPKAHLELVSIVAPSAPAHEGDPYPCSDQRESTQPSAGHHKCWDVS